MKHVLVCRILTHLGGKPVPYRYIDSHAGIGLYDLAASEAERTGEWRGGIGLMEAPFPGDVEALLAPYRAAVAATRAEHGPEAYPGSPALARALMRSGDRAILLEKHPEDAARLLAAFRRVPGVKVTAGDGWAALPGLVPPPERRGLVLIDPPYEATDELARAAERLGAAARRWRTGIFALWYPVKDPAALAAPLAAVAAALQAPCLRLELYVDRPDEDPARLNGSGLLVANPPWRLQEEAGLLLPALGERLARGGYGAFRAEPIAP